MTPAEAWQAARSTLSEDHIVHALVVAFVVIASTIYATLTRDHSGNVWIVYGSAVGYAAGRSGRGGRVGT